MRHWLVCCSVLALGAPSLAFAGCPAGQKCPPPPPPRSAPPARSGPAPNVFHPPGGGNPGGQGPRVFNPGGGAAGTQRGPNGAYGQGGRGYAPPGPSGPRHYYAPGTPGARGNGRAAGQGYAPRHSASGRTFSYHGRTFRRFAAPRYRYPYGYRYQRYGVGFFLPRVFWLPDYYVNDYDDYGLGPPPPGFQWIRYGPDILLINLYTGQIAQTVYGAYDEGDDGSYDQGGPPDGGPPDDGGPPPGYDQGPPPDDGNGTPPGGYPPPPIGYPPPQ